jgi:hypothetical protein
MDLLGKASPVFKSGAPLNRQSIVVRLTAMLTYHSTLLHMHLIVGRLSNV